MIKLKDLAPVLVRNYLAGINTFLDGKPGIGKTVTINAFAEQMQKRIPDFQLWTFYAPTMSPMDIQASAPDYDKGTLRLFNNEALPNHYRTPDARGVVFFGELPNTDPTTAKLLQKYINGEDMSGVLKKPAGVIIIADGNRLEDKSGVQQQGRAFLNRFERLEVYTDAKDCQEYALKHEWHPSVLTFFEEYPHLIDNYDEVFGLSEARQKSNPGPDRQSEEGKRGVWANMRAWERLSRLEYAAEQTHSKLLLAELVGNVGSGPGAQYDAHKAMLDRLVSFEEIMKDPEGCALPEKLDESYALSMLVALRCSEDELGQVHRFCRRMPHEMQVATLRHLSARKGINLAKSNVYVEWISDPKLSGLLNGRG